MTFKFVGDPALSLKSWFDPTNTQAGWVDPSLVSSTATATPNVYAQSVTEAASAADTVSDLAKLAVSITEAASAADTTTDTVKFSRAISETA